MTRGSYCGFNVGSQVLKSCRQVTLAVHKSSLGHSYLPGLECLGRQPFDGDYPGGEADVAPAE